MGRKNDRAKGLSASGKHSDPRFETAGGHVRLRLPPKQRTETAVDNRFDHKLKSDKDFSTSTAKVDRYGRRIVKEPGKKESKIVHEEESEDEDSEIDDDDEVQRQLEAARKKYDPARHGGFSSSDTDSDEEEEDEVEDETDVGASMQRFADERAAIEEGDITRRVAIVNLDWDYVKSHDLFALFSSFLPQDGSGKIERVSIYPSEFGKERMQREEVEGPPKELFQPSKQGAKQEDATQEGEESELDSEEEEEKIKQDLLKGEDEQDFNSDALRAYQLDRLRYYYGVMECSDPKTAHQLYEAVDGTEYLSSSNFMDLRFVPDDVTFDDDPRDECTAIPEDYKPVEFVTTALQSSKVKLTWDMHPEEASRKQTMQKAFTGSKEDLKDNDLRAYIASDSEEDDSAETAEAGLSKKELARRKLREALGLPDEPISKASDSGPVGEMQITFTSALSGKSEEPKKDDEVNETTIEKYVRKERERKEKRRQKVKANRENGDGEAGEETGQQPAEDLGFDDPFFTMESPGKPSKASIRKEERLKKREAREAEAAQKEAENERLREAMGSDGEDGILHFDMRDVLKAEKDKKKKKKKSKKRNGKEDEAGSSAAILDSVNTLGDKRFQKLLESHEFAIDPSAREFWDTEAMRTVLKEGSRKRRSAAEDEEGDEDERPRKGKKNRSR